MKLKQGVNRKVIQDDYKISSPYLSNLSKRFFTHKYEWKEQEYQWLYRRVQKSKPEKVPQDLEKI